MNLDHVLEAQRLAVVARGVNARPADFVRARLELLGRDGETQGAKKRVLRRLHEPEEIREVHDARHVGVGKLHPALRFEFVRHGGF